MADFSSEHRSDIISQLQFEKYDLLIIGGGITGAGILLDAQARGLKAALIEMQDFAAGTSSRSTKLIHGGLRYLKQLEFKLVADVGRERAIVYENGPHVTKSEPMLLPIVKGGTINTFAAFTGIWLYDKLAGVKKHEQRKMLNKLETKQTEPLLNSDQLIGGAHYYEYRTDDARLTLEIMKEGVTRGGTAINYSKVKSFIYEDGKAVGAVIKDLIGEKEFVVQASKIVNAAGPWVDEVMKLDDEKKAGNLFLTKGIHLVVNFSKFPLKQSVYFDVGDKRMVFAIPRDGKTYFGTTDTEYIGNLENPLITEHDKKYLIDAVNKIFPSLHLTLKDIESGWAGLRPLIRQAGKSPSEISRKDEVYVNASGLISIAGGKLTGYRKMAKKILDMLSKEYPGKKLPECTTHSIPVSGGKVGGSKNFKSFVDKAKHEGVHAGLTDTEAMTLSEIYGSNVFDLFKIAKSRREEAEKAGIPLFLFTRLLYAIESEMTVSPADFFIRRTGMLYFHIDELIKWQEAVIAYMKTRFSWTDEVEKKYKDELEFQLKIAKG